MFIINKRRAFYNYVAVTLILFTVIFSMFILGLYFESGGFTYKSYISFGFFLILFLFDMYYIMNLIYDNRIRKYGKIKKARIIKVVYGYRNRDTVIVYEYKNQYGKIIHTKEMIGRSFRIFLKVDDRVIIRTNGNKGVISRKDYK